MRWEYSRRPPYHTYLYPLGHLHVNGRFTDRSAEADKPLSQLHLSSSRVPFELVLWHLIADWGVPSKSPDWQELLGASIEKFQRKRTVPNSPGPAPPTAA